jgi:hypothetical protein
MAGVGSETASISMSHSQAEAGRVLHPGALRKNVPPAVRWRC